MLERWGAAGAMSRLILKKTPSKGFDLAVKYGLDEETYEAIALRYADRFDPEVIEAAKARLDAIGYKY
jgi:hypothetical protein